jgi:4-hydroxybenzoate polyprenyltransferase
MVKYINFLRWKNLSIIAVVIFSLKYWVFETLITSTDFILFSSTFTFLQTLLLTISVMLVAAGGYVINDINDTIADRVNKSDKTLLLDLLSESQAQLLYFVLTLSGIGLGLYLATQLGLYQLIILHITSSALLWIYSSYFKSSVLLGNIIVSILSALVPLTYFCFETYSFIASYGKVFEIQYDSYFAVGPLSGLWNYTLALAVFAFIYTLIREIIKDLEDLEGDKKLDGDTLPLAIGTSNTLWIVRALLIIAVTGVLSVYYIKLQLAPFDLISFHGYIYVTLVFPSLYIIWLSFKIEMEYEKASKILKIIMLFGILSSYLFYTFQ